MRNLLFVGILLLAGCQNVDGPRQHRQPVRVDDPQLSITEQERLGRDRLALPDESYTAGPPAPLVRPERLGPAR